VANAVVLAAIVAANLEGSKREDREGKVVCATPYPMLWSHVVFCRLILIDIPWTSDKEFLHGDYVGRSNDARSRREVHRQWPDKVKARIVSELATGAIQGE
jgi:hypothetical protein